MIPKVIELTKDNKNQYLDQVAELEIKVLDNMEKNGKTGQLFITGKEGIEEYIDSENNTVMCAVDENDKVKSAVYVTQGQLPFTYNDITKYFKCGPEHEKDVRERLKNRYNSVMVDIYIQKLDAYMYAREKILAEHPEYKDINEYIEHELNSQNGFDEKSELREKINEYMSSYMISKNRFYEYEDFYWTTSEDILRDVYNNRSASKTNSPIRLEYDNFLNNSKLIIHEQKIDKIKDYFRANTQNSVEIDTYITDPESRHSGLARILVFEGIKKHIKKHFNDLGKTEIFLCSTLHKQNLSSKYVSEFFGLTDNLYVKRRNSRDREVHICRIEREQYHGYLENIEDKLIVLYGYNPKGKVLSDDRKLQLLKEQLKYEKQEYYRLNRIRNEKKDYKGKLSDIMPKLNRIGQIKAQIKRIEQKIKGDER